MYDFLNLSILQTNSKSSKLYTKISPANVATTKVASETTIFSTFSALSSLGNSTRATATFPEDDISNEYALNPAREASKINSPFSDMAEAVRLSATSGLSSTRGWRRKKRSDKKIKKKKIPDRVLEFPIWSHFESFPDFWCVISPVDTTAPNDSFGLQIIAFAEPQKK
jgi:hypothetical protein